MRKILWLLMMLPTVASSATWFWRPNTGTYGLANGSSYQNAWSKESQIKWGLMKAGDKLFVCGRHDTGYLDRKLQTGRSDITISGNCPGDPGSILSVGERFEPNEWRGPSVSGVYTRPYAGSPSLALDDLGQLRLLGRIPTAKSPCRTYFYSGGTFYYRPCGRPLTVLPTGGSPAVRITHDRVTVEYLALRNAGTGIEVRNARGVIIRHSTIWEHAGIGIALSGSTSDGKIQYNEIHNVTDGIYAMAGTWDRHDRWLIEGNFIHDIGGSGDSHGIGWQSGSDLVIRNNAIFRPAGSGITIYAWRNQENSRNLIEGNTILDVVRSSLESNERGIELSGDSCWNRPDLRRNDVIRNNIVYNAAEGIYVKFVAAPGENSGVTIEDNQIKARKTGIRWGNPNGGTAPELTLDRNSINAPLKLDPVTSSSDFCG